MTAADQYKKYEELFGASQGYDIPNYQQEFEKAYGEAANYNKDLIDQKSGYIEQAQAMPAQMREQYYSSPIRNPLAQEALIATRRGGITGDISRVTDLLGQRGARYQDILGKHTAAYESAAQRAERAAENQWRMYQDALAQEEAARARAAAAAEAAALRDLITQLQTLQDIPQEEENEYSIPDESEYGQGLFERKPTMTNTVQDALASGVLRYRNAPNALGKYWELMRGTALSSLGGIPGMAAYTTAVAPDVWGDIKGGVSSLWNKLRRR
jgi:hypothetical protein